MTYYVICLYASLKGEDIGPWMIAAEDEYAWEGDPDRCERVFATARDLAARNDWDVREVLLSVPLSHIYKAFEPAEVEAAVESSVEATP